MEALRIFTGNFHNQDKGVSETLVDDRPPADHRSLNLNSTRHQETLKVSRARSMLYGVPELTPW